jgi:hypothetical protein
VALDDYRMEQLMKRIWTPLYDEFAKIHDTTPAEVELEDFAERTRAAEEKRHRDLVAEKERLTQELVELKHKANTMNLPAEEYDAIEAQMLALAAQYERLEKRDSLTRPLMDEKQMDFFARWYVSNWKKQRALYKKYGGRVIWQQVGPEAIDAMRDLLKQREREGCFTISDPDLHDRFWEYFVNDRMHVFIPDPDRIFKHPWSPFENARAAAAKE